MRPSPSPARRVAAWLTAIGVYLAASSSQALHGAPGPSGDEAIGDEAIGQIWRDAQARIETSDYAGAIERLTRLYELLAADPEAKTLRLRVIWALHQAHVGASAVDGDPSHLYVARDLLNKYRAELTGEEVEQRERADRAAAEVDARIAAAEANRPTPEPEPAAPIPIPIAEPPPPKLSSSPVEDAGDGEPRPGQPLVIAGGASLGVGVIGLAMVAGGFASARSAVGRFEREPDQRDDARRAAERGNRIGIAGSIVAGIGIATGAALLGVGLSRRRSSTPRGSVALAGDRVMLSLTGRF